MEQQRMCGGKESCGLGAIKRLISPFLTSSELSTTTSTDWLRRRTNGVGRPQEGEDLLVDGPN